MKNILSVLGSAFVAMTVLSGCGGSGGAMTVLSGCGGSGGTCCTSAPCGGDIVATWTIKSTCLTTTDSPGAFGFQICPGATLPGNIKIAGTVTYNSDLTYVLNTTGSETVTFPVSCLTMQGQTMTCAQLSANSVARTCTGTSSCTCTTLLPQAPSTERTGTYTTTPAGVVTETPTGNTPSQSDYCVKGTTLTLSPHPDSNRMGLSAGTVTLTKP
jgi:hypothetical protein